MIDEKVKGHEITAAPKTAAKAGPVIDLMEALRRSMKKVPEKKAGARRKTRKKAGRGRMAGRASGLKGFEP
jgi:non-homologous end joining protein Ku